MAFDAIRDVFTPTALARLRSQTNPSRRLQERLHTLQATGTYPSEPTFNMRVQRWRATKAAWDAYLTAGFACGLFDGPEGEDVRSRLVGDDDDNFRSALSECLTCWFFAGKLGLKVEPRPKGQKGRVPDLLVHMPDGEVHAEVKAPYVPPAQGSIWSGNDHHILAATVSEAAKQFARPRRNLLVLVPTLRIPVSSHRGQLIQAFFGEFKIVVPIDLSGSGESLPPARTEFFPDGKFLKPWDEGRPRFTRIGGVLCLEEQLKERGDFDSPDRRVWVEHSSVIVHNPYAPNRILTTVWGDAPQLIEKDGGLRWSDGQAMSR